MSSNIFQLWKKNGDLVPFGARRDTWATHTHVLVEEVILRRWPYGTAYGHVYRNGAIQPPLGPKGAVSISGIPEISCAGCYQWTFVEIAGCPRGKPAFKAKRAKILAKGEKIGFGIHRASTVEEVLRRDPSWIKWAIQNVKYFAVDPTLIDASNSQDAAAISEDVRAINEERVRKVLGSDQPRSRS